MVTVVYSIDIAALRAPDMPARGKSEALISSTKMESPEVKGTTAPHV